MERVTGSLHTALLVVTAQNLFAGSRARFRAVMTPIHELAPPSPTHLLKAAIPNNAVHRAPSVPI